jgi:hypothetical protein
MDQFAVEQVEERILALQQFTPDEDTEFCPSSYSGCPSNYSFVC